MSKKLLSVAIFIFIHSLLLVTSDKNLSQLASAHFSRVLRDAKCNFPVPRMVYMSDLNPPPNKKYLPYGTLLHVCGPEVGCCPHESDICVAKSVEKVELYFWVLELTPHGSKKSVESFMFNNHTHCECRHRSLNISSHSFANNYDLWPSSAAYSSQHSIVLILILSIFNSVHNY